MSRPPRPQMISPSPTCTRRLTTPDGRSAPTVMNRSSWMGENLEGHNRAPATSAGRCLWPVGGDCVATSRHKSQNVDRAHHSQVTGQRVHYVCEFVPPVHCRCRLQCTSGQIDPSCRSSLVNEAFLSLPCLELSLLIRAQGINLVGSFFLVQNADIRPVVES